MVSTKVAPIDGALEDDDEALEAIAAALDAARNASAVGDPLGSANEVAEAPETARSAANVASCTADSAEAM